MSVPNAMPDAGLDALDLSVLVFTDAAHASAGHALAEAVGGRYVHKGASSIDALLAVSAFGVVEPVVVIVHYDNDVLLRMTTLPDAPTLTKRIHQIAAHAHMTAPAGA